VTIRGLLLIVVVVTVGVAIIVPIARRGRIEENETSAIGALRTLAKTESTWQIASYVDQDGDGLGEFGFFYEMAAAACNRTEKGTSPEPVWTSYFNPVFGTTALANGGVATNHGYHFRIYLPSASGTAIPEPAQPIPGNPADADVQERRWVCYAWPVEVGRTGRRAFVVSRQGEVFDTANDGFQNYSGTGNTPEPGAAFVVAYGFENADNLEGQFVAGERAGDGHVWIPAGN
jgi:hypothetical protein